MRIIWLAAAIALTLSLASCGGGGGDPINPSHDLSGLTGTWDLTVNFDGILSLDDGEKGDYHDSLSGSWVIDSTHVWGANGQSLVWQYDGSTLVVTVQNTIETTGDCGDTTTTGNCIYNFKIHEGQTSSGISGNFTMDIYTDYCGNGVVTGVIQGNFVKQ